MENKTVLALVVVSLVMAFAIVFTVTNKEENMISIPSESSITAPDTFKETFVTGCVSESATYSFCSCSYDSMINHLGKDGLIEMSLDYIKTEKIPESVLKDIMNDCLK